MKKLICLFFFSILLMPSYVLAVSNKDCSFTLLSDLKKIANNVDISYEYHIVDDEVSFDVTIANITEDIYFKLFGSNISYHYSDTDNGVITFKNYVSGVHKFAFYSENSECANERLSIRTVDLPYYNKYYDYDICSNVPNYKLCQKWVKYDGTFENFSNSVKKYIKSLEKKENVDDIKELNFFDKIVCFVLNYYYLILPIGALLIIGILRLIRFIKFRRNRFDI